MEVEGGLVCGGESAVERVGEHRLALRAVLRIAALTGPALPNWLKSLTLHHLPFYTLQKPCKFPPAAADAAFYGSFGDAEDLRYLFVIHIFQIAKNNSFAKLGGELF